MNQNTREEKADQRVLLSRQIFRDAMLRILEKKHIMEISVSELCREAGLNRSTFYRLYSIPAEVLEEILQSMIDEIHEKIFAAHNSYQENLLTIYQYIYEHRGVMRMVLNNQNYRILTLLENKYYTLLRDELGVQDSEERCRILCAALTAGGTALAAKWLESDDPMPPTEISKLHYAFLNPLAVFHE